MSTGSKPISRRGLMIAGPALLAAGCAFAAETEAAAGGPRLNQLGFSPRSPKRFVLPVAPGDAAARTFRVETLSGRSVLEGRLDPHVHDLTRTAGEHVRIGDFSALVAPGRYRVRVGTQASHPFGVAEGLYRPLVRDAARAFFLIRANVALDDPVTGIKHAAGHPGDASLSSTPRRAIWPAAGTTPATTASGPTWRRSAPAR
jgi:endoglucanase